MSLDHLEENLKSKLERERPRNFTNEPQAYDSAYANQAGAQASAGSGLMNPAAYLENLFSYHSPRPDQIPQYQAIRSAAKHFAEVVMQNTPPGADQADAIREIRKAVMMANASIGLDGRC